MTTEQGVFWLSSTLLALAIGAIFWGVCSLAPGLVGAYRRRFLYATQSQTRQLYLAWNEKTVFIANLFLMFVAVLLAWYISESLLVVLAVMVFVYFLPRILFARIRRTRLKKFDQQLPDALLMLSGGLRSGLSLATAFQHLVEGSPAPLGQEFGLVLRENRLGVPLDIAMSNLARRVPTNACMLVISAIRVAHETGGGLGETLERTSVTIRKKLQMEGKISALTSQGRLQAWVVGSMPLVLMLVLNHIEPDGMSALWHTPIGWLALGVIAILEVTGVLLILKIATIDV